MARTNILKSPYDGPQKTHEGGPAWQELSKLEQLRRSVMSCLLWEREFYEDGQAIADRIETLASQVAPNELADVAIEARNVMHLRHVPLFLLAILARTGAGIPGLVANTVEQVIQRADEPGELLSLYWRKGKTPISKQLKLGLARALRKFDAYQLGKYDRDAAVKLRDVLFLVHAKPADENQAALWKKLADGELETPDTWEVALSGGADKRETFERLLREGKLGYLALLRNLRNMDQAGVDPALVEEAIRARKGAGRVLPFRYVAAARAAPRWEPAIDAALQAAVGEMVPLPGQTVVLVDVSGSMDVKLSAKSDMTRLDAAAALASILPGQRRVFTFSQAVVEIPPRVGMAGIDAIQRSQVHGGTWLGRAVEVVNIVPHDRLIVITDEQTADRVPDPVAKRAYMVNVASAQNGVGYGKWTHLDGWSEGVVRWIAEIERHWGR